MRKDIKSGENRFRQLRDEAERMIGNRQIPHDPSVRKLDELLQELQVHQVELELQNDELQLANEELAVQRMKFTAMYDLAPVSYFVLNSKALIEDMNGTARSVFNRKSLDWKGCNFRYLVGPDSLDAWLQFFEQLLNTPGKQTGKVKLLASDGLQLEALLEGVFIKSIARCFIAVIDVTENIRSTEQLSETSDRLTLALKAASAGSWELHLDTMKLTLDGYNYRILDVEPGSFDETYRAFIDLIHPDDRFRVDQAFRRAINDEQEIDLSCRFIHCNDSICHAVIRGHVAHKANGAGSFVGIMMDVTEKILAEEEAAHLKESRQNELLLTRFSAEENERKRISEGLHDSVSQLLYGIKIELGQINDSNNAASIARLHELLNIAIRETRNISFELAPAILTDFGLKATLEELASRFSSEGFRIEANFTGLHERMDMQLETTIFRIIQELVNNCMKHSGADRVLIEVKHKKNLEIKVSDNGRGFNVKKLDRQKNGSGLSSVRNRLQVFNGTVEIDSEEGKGTSVKIKLPGSDKALV